METIWHKPSLKKPVITSHSTLIIAMLAIADIIFLTNLLKRANPTELKLPLFNNKSSKIIYYGEAKISWIMSTDWYQLRFNLLLQSLLFGRIVNFDVIFDFQLRSFSEVSTAIFRQQMASGIPLW
jgi:hypothetical protein